MSHLDPKTLIIKRPTEGGCAGGLWAIRFVHTPDSALLGRELSLTEERTFGRVRAGATAPSWYGVADRRVSSEHVALRPMVGGRLILVDLGSSNGTFVNGARAQTAELAEGDVVRLGSTLGVVTCRADAGKVPAWWSERLATWSPSAAFRATLRQVDGMDNARPLVCVGEAGTGKKALLRVLAYMRAGRLPTINVVDAKAADARLVASALSGLTDEVLILEGIEHLPVEVQGLFAKALTERPARALGGVMATAHMPLEESGLDPTLVRGLLPCAVTMPPLRRRREELLSLAQTMVPPAAGTADAPTVDDRALVDAGGAEALLLHDWPDNVRGLERCIVALAMRQARPFTGPAVLDELEMKTRLTMGTRKKSEPPPRPMVSEKLRSRPSREGLKAALASHGHDIEAAAKALGVDKVHVMRWLRDDDEAEA